MCVILVGDPQYEGAPYNLLPVTADPPIQLGLIILDCVYVPLKLKLVVTVVPIFVVLTIDAVGLPLKVIV